VTRQTILDIIIKVVRRVVNKSATSWQQVCCMEFGKRHDTTDTTDFSPRRLVMNLLYMTYYGKLVFPV